MTTKKRFHSSLPTKTSFGPDGKKQLSFPTNDLNKLFHGSEARLRGHHRRQECRRSVGWATLLSPLLPRSLPTKTSFGTDWKGQFSMPNNDLQKLFYRSNRR